MDKVLQVEICHENGEYSAYIGEDGASIYEIRGATAREVADQVADYIEDCYLNEEE